MDSGKTRSKTKFRIKFLLCLNPVTKDDSFKPRKQEDTTGPVPSYFPTAYEETVLLPSLPSTTLSTAGRSEAENDSSRRKKCSGWQTLKRAFKETYLAKKIKKMKTFKDKSLKSNRNISVSKSDESTNLSKELPFDPAKRIDSNASSSFRCSYAFTPSPLSSRSSSSSRSDLGSSSSSEMSRSTPLSRNSMLTMKQRQHRIKESRGPNGSNKVLGLLMVTLMVLVLWGKACAVLSASIWLFLVPHRSLQHHRPPPWLVEQGEFDSVEYKKRVIMKGLLERSRSRVCMGPLSKSQRNFMPKSL